MPERERLKQILVEVLERLLQLATDEGDYQTALKHARQLLQIDPSSSRRAVRTRVARRAVHDGAERERLRVQPQSREARSAASLAGNSGSVTGEMWED